MYLQTNKVWVPATENSTVHQLTAVLLPPDQEQITTFQSYLELLAMRVSWMIQQEEKMKAIKMIEQAIVQAWISQIETPATSASPQEWAESITMSNPTFQEALMFLDPSDRPLDHNLLEFPAEAIDLNPEIQERLQETTLEEWLALMVATCTR